MEEGGGVPLLDCSSSCSPLSVGMLTRLLAADDPLPHAYTTTCVQLCGHMTVMCSSFTGQADFLLFLQSVHTLEDLVATGAARGQVDEVAVRCTEWLQCMECYVHRYLVNSLDRGPAGVRSHDLAEVLLKWLQVIVDHMGPLRDTSQSCDYHMTRLWLHVHWTAVSVTFRLAPLVGWTWFLGQARHTVSLLLSVAASLPLSPSLPGCACFTQLWLLLRYTLDHTNNTSFWSIVTSLMSRILDPSQPSDSAEEEVEISPCDVIQFSWWIVDQLVHLYGFTEEGTQEMGREMVPHWDIVHILLPITFKQGCTEEQLQSSLRVCVSLMAMWPLSTFPLLTAWDYYHKHMDDPLLTTARSINEWASPEGSAPQQWMQYILSLFQTQSHSHTTKPHPPGTKPRPSSPEFNSFQLFLQLIYITMATGSRKGTTWRQLKGRFYSKLHRRWLCERKGVGLQCVMSLLLTLAWTGDAREVALKMVSLLNQIGLGDTSMNSSLLWRAVFTMLSLLVEKEEQIGDIIEKIQPALTSLAKPHPPESCDHQRKALSVILESTVDIVESGVRLGGAVLIGSHLTDLLTSTEGSHVTQVLSMVESLITILTQFPITPPTLPHTTACQSLWKHCSQPLLALAHLPLTPSSLPSTLAALTTLTCHHQHITSPLTVFNDVSKDTVNPMLASGYVSHVIESDVIRHHILTTDSTQLLALHVWFRCLAELDHTPSATPTTVSTALLQLTDQLHKLPLVTALLGNQATPTDPMSMLHHLLEAMETSYTTLDDGSAEWRMKLATMLGDLPRYLDQSLAGTRGTAAIRHAYNVAGMIVARAPRLTYSRIDSRCLLPRLVDWLVLPLPSSSSSSSSTSRRPQPQGISTAIKSHLHLFLSGLLQLHPERDDFIRRKVKQLFSRYFYHYCQPTSPLLSPSHNPFLLALRPWFVQGGCYGDGDVLQLVMEVITSQFLCLPQQPASLSPTLQFIKTVVEKAQSPLLWVTMTPPLLGHMTSCLLACDVCPPASEPPVIRELVMSILTPLITACRDHQDLLPCSLLVPTLADFVASNMSVEQALLMKPLISLGNMYPDLLKQLAELLDNDSSLQSISHTLHSILS